MPRRDSPETAKPAPAPDFSREAALIAAGRRAVAGVDEAGRGPLAGPVVVSAVVLDPARIPQGLDDSKKLTAQKREALHAQIVATAHVAVVIAPPQLIARYNIRGATLWAMRRAVLALAVPADYALIDGRDVPQGLPCLSQAVIGGDALSVSIAAASIIAKVTRDRMCAIMDCDEPAFGFSSHKGYSSPQHLSALATHGPGRHHRLDFAPCSEAAAARREAFTLS